MFVLCEVRKGKRQTAIQSWQRNKYGQSAKRVQKNTKTKSHRGELISFCECCVLSSRGLCDEPIPYPEESYRLWCIIVRDLETSRMRRPWPTWAVVPKKKNIILRFWDFLCCAVENRVFWDVTLRHCFKWFPRFISRVSWFMKDVDIESLMANTCSFETSISSYRAKQRRITS